MCDLNPKTRANAEYFVSVCICYIGSDENFRNIAISRGLVCKVCLYKQIKCLQSRIETFSHDMWCEVKLAGRVHDLGFRYAGGFGVNKDLAFACELLRFVFNNGYIDAACDLGYVLAEQGAMDEAQICWEVGKCNKCVVSTHNLGVLYRDRGEIATVL